MQRSRKKRSFFNTDGKMDITFLSLVLILLTIGLVMLFSASYAFSYENYGNSYKFISRQAIFAVLGVAIMLVVSTVNYHVYRKFAWIFYIAVMGVLVFLLAMPPMLEGMDVKRWLVIGPINFQPSELAKTGIIMLLALYMTKHEDAVMSRGFNRRSIVHGFLVPAAIIGLVCVLVGLEKHFSGIIIIGCIGVAMMFISGTNFLYFVSCIPVAGLLGFLIMKTGYASARVNSWLNRGADALGSDWQTTQGLYAIGTGGLFGLGLGSSRQKFGYVSEPQNDFIFTIIFICDSF